MRLWRLTRAPFAALDGKGAELHGSRYAPPGSRVVSLASEAGLAVLVALRYQPADLSQAPDDLVLGWTEVDAVPLRVSDPEEDQAAPLWAIGWRSAARCCARCPRGFCRKRTWSCSIPHIHRRPKSRR